MKIVKYGDVGTNETLKHKSLKIVIVEGQPRARVRNISPIDSMYDKGKLNTAQYSAGVKLYSSYVRGWCTSTSYEVTERVDGGGYQSEITTSQLQAMDDYNKGIKAAGDEIQLIVKVVLHEMPLTPRGLSGSAKVKLKKRLSSALDNIARAYGFL